MPGVLILEALAQTGAVAILSRFRKTKGKIAYFGGIENVNSAKGKVVPGDRLCLETRIIRTEGTGGNRRGNCQCRRKDCCKGRADIYDRSLDNRHDQKGT